MQPFRRIIDDAPNVIPVPEELRHRRVELILWPLDDAPWKTKTRARPTFNIADVECIEIPSREERNAQG
uniref:Uncharacterized protein n=1 Tax=Candidatus Kentrum sp. LPFa TaxID=2126335 RepID=A0A450W113_9GAMM|nr:MAG: hypothetical protein BECKLPF1236B_GA0070989_101529 [Candidatus Kentron sp. LPFa]